MTHATKAIYRWLLSDYVKVRWEPGRRAACCHGAGPESGLTHPRLRGPASGGAGRVEDVEGWTPPEELQRRSSSRETVPV